MQKGQLLYNALGVFSRFKDIAKSAFIFIQTKIGNIFKVFLTEILQSPCLAHLSRPMNNQRLPVYIRFPSR